MTTYKQKKERAKKAGRPYEIVSVSFDFGLSAERYELLAEIANAAPDAREGFDPATEARAKLDKLEESEKDALIRVKLYRTDAQVWGRLCAENDYDPNKVSPAAISRGDGRIIDGKTELEQTPEEWDEFFSLIAPSDFTALKVACARLNEGEPSERVERLKKLLAATTASNGS